MHAILVEIDPHLLRHTFITRLIENGADPISVQEIVGHASLQTTMRYAHPQDSLKDAVGGAVYFYRTIISLLGYLRYRGK